MKRDNTDHVRVGAGGRELVCTACGERQRAVLPMRVSVWCAMARAFEAEHRRCARFRGVRKPA